MDVGAIANEWLGAFPIGEAPLYRGPDDHWLYDLPSAALFELPTPVRFPQPAAYTARADYQGENPEAVPRIRITRSTPMYDDPIYNYSGDPLTRIALGQVGTVDPAGPYYGGLDPSYQVFNLSDAAMATQRFLSSWNLPAIGLPPLRFPNTPPATQQAAQPGAGWAIWLLYGGLALAAVLLLKR